MPYGKSFVRTWLIKKPLKNIYHCNHQLDYQAPHQHVCLSSRFQRFLHFLVFCFSSRAGFWLAVIRNSGFTYVSGKLTTYPSSNLTLILTSHFKQNVGLGEGLAYVQTPHFLPHAEKRRLRNAVPNRVPVSCCLVLYFAWIMVKIGDGPTNTTPTFVTHVRLPLFYVRSSDLLCF